jgi:hypothetical protein
MLRTADQLLGLTVLYNFPQIEDVYALCDLSDDGEIMRDERGRTTAAPVAAS